MAIVDFHVHLTAWGNVAAPERQAWVEGFPACLGTAGLDRVVLFALDNELVARTVARDLYRKPEWAEVLAGVASADPEWLQVGDALRVAADDDAGGEIDLAFAEAIGHSPERVLEYARGLDDPGAFADLCGALPSDEPAPRCERALGRRRRAVQRLDPSRWADQAEACREAIDSAYADLQEEED